MTILQAIAVLTLAAASANGAQAEWVLPDEKTASERLAANRTLLETRLPDQNGGSDSLAAHLARPVLLVVVDARKLGTIRRWEQALSGRFPHLDVVTVADVNEKNRPTLERVSEVLAKRVPAGVRVLIDMERLFATTLSLDTTAPNLVVIDPTGIPLTTVHGRYEPDLEADVVAALVEAGASR